MCAWLTSAVDSAAIPNAAPSGAMSRGHRTTADSQTQTHQAQPVQRQTAQPVQRQTALEATTAALDAWAGESQTSACISAAVETHVRGAPLKELLHVESWVIDILGGVRSAIRARETLEDEERRCPVCFDNVKDTALNCGHRFCGACAVTIDECALCRVTITHRIQLF